MHIARDTLNGLAVGVIAGILGMTVALCLAMGGVTIEEFEGNPYQVIETAREKSAR